MNKGIDRALTLLLPLLLLGGCILNAAAGASCSAGELLPSSQYTCSGHTDSATISTGLASFRYRARLSHLRRYCYRHFRRSRNTPARSASGQWYLLYSPVRGPCRPSVLSPHL